MEYMKYTKNTGGVPMVHFDEKFYRGEFRCEFFVSSKMKRAWAAQIEVLAEIDRICQKYNITYFADSGTLLGAVRHNGFIPWDDDLDIAMLRKDYERFLRVCQNELKSEYKLFISYEQEAFDQTFVRIANDIGLKKCGKDLTWCHGFEYFAGIDIFPLDYIAHDETEFELQCHLTELIDIARQMVRKKIKEVNGLSAREVLKNIEELCHTNFERGHDLEKQLIMLFDRVCTMYSEEESEELTLFLYVNKDPEYRLKKEWYSDVVLIDFEGVKIPCPIGYKEVLKTTYGDYMKYVKGTAAHDYPYYKKYEKAYEDEYCKKLCQEVKKTLSNMNNISMNTITEMQVLKYGIRNQTVFFKIYDKEFVMRVARGDRNHILNREVEKKIYGILEQYEISDRLYTFDEMNGNKIVEFVTNARKCDVNNWDDVSMCMQILKFLHGVQKRIEYSFDMWERIEAYEKLWGDESYFQDYKEIKEKAREMYDFTQKQEKSWGLTHFEPDADNFLIVEKENGQADIRIIDWEYAGMQDTHMDIAMFALQAGYSKEQLDDLINLYFMGACEPEIRKKIYCYVALGALFYSNYYEYYDRKGIEMNEETLRYYQVVKEYYEIWKYDV